MARRVIAANVVLALMLGAAGCTGIATGQTDLHSMGEPPGQVVSTASMAGGHALTMRITDADVALSDGTRVRNRCWTVAESDRDGTIVQTVGACTHGEEPATQFAIDATVVVTSCSSPSIAVGLTADELTAELPARSGAILVPAEITGGRPDSIAFACVGADGARQPAVVLAVP